MIDAKIAKNINYHDVLHHLIQKNADGSPQRWVVNGNIKFWKRDRERFCIPVKHGLTTHAYVTEHNGHDFEVA
jgi:hypothetical protein